MDAILIRTHNQEEGTIRNVRDFENLPKDSGFEAFVVHDATDKPKFDSANLPVFNFTINDYYKSGYPIASLNEIYELPTPPKLGSRSAPIYFNPDYANLLFYKKYPDYENYWYIESDIVFTGQWITFLEACKKLKYDLLVPMLRQYPLHPVFNKFWDSLNFEIHDKAKLAMFGCIWRASKRMYDMLDKEYTSGKHGYYELIIPSLAAINELDITDINAAGLFYHPMTLSGKAMTSRWTPNFIKHHPDKLFHPVVYPLKTLLFATGYIGNESHIERYVRYINYYSKYVSHLGANNIVIIDDGSPIELVEKLKEQVEYKFEIIDYNNLPEKLDKGINWIRFPNRLGRPELMTPLGWWRSFSFVSVLADKYTFDKLIHIESDFYVLTARLIEFVKNMRTGWTALFSKNRNGAESGLQIIAKEYFNKLKFIYESGFDLWNKVSTNKAFYAERMLPFTNTIKCFKGDRYGEDWCWQIPEDADYVANMGDVSLNKNQSEEKINWLDKRLSKGIYEVGIKGRALKERAIDISIWAYVLCWNEEKMIPYYLRHYEKFCDKIIVYDNYSTDKSIKILKAHPKVEIRYYDSKGKIRDDIYLQIKNEVWKETKYLQDDVDFVIVGDMDEFLWHKNMKEFLFKKQREGYTIFKPTGYDMLNEDYPTTDKQIYHEVQTGRSDQFISGKLMLFNPHKIEEIAYDYGCHLAKPLGKVNLWEDKNNELVMMHFKSIGRKEVKERHEIFNSRLSEFNIKTGMGVYNPKVDLRIQNFDQHLKEVKRLLIFSPLYIAIQKIKTLPLKDLKTLKILTDIIGSCGLMYDDSDRYGKYKMFMNEKGKLGLEHNPQILAELLIDLSYYRINSFAFTDIEFGYSLAIIGNYLKRFNSNIKILGFDTNKNYKDLEVLLDFDYIQGTSADFKNKIFDFVFINKYFESDYDNIGKNASLCAFNKLRNDYKFKDKIYKKYSDGLGLLLHNPKKRNLLITTIGKNSVCPVWTNAERNYDVFYICYHEEAYEKFKRDDIKIIKRQGFKYPLLKQIFKERINIEQYDYYFLPDYDILINTIEINKLFDYMREYNLSVAQPSIVDVNVSHRHLICQPENILRFCAFVEVMTPCFSKEALKKCLPYFDESKSGWGQDILWWKVLNEPKNKFAIIDDIKVTHTLKSDIKTGELYLKTMIDPHEELKQIKKKYRIENNFEIFSKIKHSKKLP